MKKLSLLQKQAYIDQYTISGLWVTMCGYIVLLFMKEFLTQHYLIGFSIDLLVAVVFFYIALHNLLKQKHVLDELKLPLKPLQVEIVGFVAALFVVIITCYSPFDISFLLLVMTYLTSKKMVVKEIER